MNSALQRKIELALQLIENAARMAEAHGQILEIAYSGGKDSDCILELARMANVKYQAIYKNTTIDPPYTIAHCKANGVEIRQPQMRFAEIIRRNGMPSRHYRICCHYLKEYKILDYVVIGVRRSESTKRAKRYKEPEVCRVFKAGEKERQYLPLLEWGDDDVKEFIEQRNIKCHPLYYDDEGNFHVERRLGCLCCPLLSKGKRRDEFLHYPKMLKFYINNIREFIANHPHNALTRHFGDEYGAILRELFFDTHLQFKEAMQPDLWGNVLDCKKYLETYFNIDL